MPRIRTIKPTYWNDEKCASLDDSTRLLFIALWNMADDAGRVVDSPKAIEAFVWPFSEASLKVQRGLSELARIGVIQRGRAANGAAIIQVTNWGRHQRINRPNVAGALPPIACATTTSATHAPFTEASVKPHGSLSEASVTEVEVEVEVEGEGEEEGEGEVEEEAATAAADPIEAMLPGCPWGDLPLHHADAIRGALRAAQHPPSLAAELRVLADGGLRGGGPVPWWAIGQALHDLRLAGGRLTANALRGFVRSAMADAGAQSPLGAPDALQAMLAAARAEVAALEGSQEAA